jgi:hypothetical protein
MRLESPARPERDEAYAPLEAPDTLPVVSLLLFSIALGSRPLMRLLPPELRPYPWGVLLPVVLALGASALGALLAALALRGVRRRGLARVALLVNLVVLGLTALAAAAMVWILRR